MKFSDLLILGGAGVVIYFFLKGNNKGKSNDNYIKQTPLTKDMNAYSFEETTMRPPLFSDNLVSSFNTSKSATVAPSTLSIYKIK